MNKQPQSQNALLERALVVLLALASIAPAVHAFQSRAESKAQESEALCRPAQTAADCAVTINNQGSAYFASAKYQDAGRMFTLAISLWSSEPAVSDDLAKAYRNLGAVYRIEEKYSDAAHCFLRALDVRESLQGQGDVSLLPILNDLGRLYLEMGESRQAQNTLRRAMAI